MRPMRKNFSRRFFKWASTDFTFFGGTRRIIPTPILKDCSNSPVSILPSLARYLKIAATGDVREGGNPAARDNIFQRRRVTQMRLQQFRANLISDFGDVDIRLQLRNFENQFPRQRVSVSVQTGGRERQQSVSGLDVLAGQ